MNIELVKFWLLLLPSLFLYLITDRGVKVVLLVPIIWVALEFANNWKTIGNHLEKGPSRSLLAYFFIATAAVCSGTLGGSEQILVRDIFIIGSSILLFLFPTRISNTPKWLFLCFTAAYFYILMRAHISLSQIAELFTYNLILPTTTVTENDWGIVFGLFTVHFFLMKSWRYFCPSVFVSLMVSKRALLIGVFVSLGWWLVFGKTDKISQTKKTISLVFVYLSFTVSAIFLTEVGQMVLEWIGLEGMSVSRFLMGRNSLVLTLRSHIDLSAITAYFGHGPGTADTYLAYNGGNSGWGALTGAPFNPHNDYMKVIFDYGIFGYTMFFLILLNFYGKTSKGKALMAYTLTVFCFDNSLIFMIFHIAAGFICAEYTKLEKDAYQNHV